jgi:LuxR family maltose regulon positive regulatory protein
MQGDWTSAGSLAREALAEFGDNWWADPAGRFLWNTSARSVALSESWDDEDPLVRDATIAMSRDAERGLSLVGVRAMGQAMAGHPVEALRVAAGVRHAAASMSILRSELGIAEALARYELGDPCGLEELRAIADAPTDLRFYCTIAAMLGLAQAAADAGDAQLAARELARAHALVAEEHGGPDLRTDWTVGNCRRTGQRRTEDAQLEARSTTRSGGRSAGASRVGDETRQPRIAGPSADACDMTWCSRC